MSRPPGPVPFRVNRSILLTLSLILCAPLFAIDIDPKLDQAIRAGLPVCSVDAKVSYDTAPLPLPQGFKGVTVKVESQRPTCAGQFMAITSPSGGFFLGSPWPIANGEGTTVEEKLRSFTARNMREAMDVKVERTANEDGLWPVTLYQTTEAGKLPFSGFVDPQARIFFFGTFRRGDAAAHRAKSFDTWAAGSPSKGNGAITVLEFSDFQCPSCKYASGYGEALLAKHGDKVRYVRYDLPLSGHAWAFPAALVGRAIYRQKPEAFWDYKKTVYASQESLNAFTFWDWARNWAEDHELDLAKYDADLNDAALKAQILNAAGYALSNDVRATPTYIVNGVVVDAGDEGKALLAYVDQLAGGK